MKYCKMLSDLWSLWCPNDWCHSKERCRMVRAGWQDGAVLKLGVPGPKVPMVSNSNILLAKCGGWKQSDLTMNAMPVGYGSQSCDPGFSCRKFLTQVTYNVALGAVGRANRWEEQHR